MGKTYALGFVGDQVLFIAIFFLLSGLFQILAEGAYTAPRPPLGQAEWG